MKKMPVEGVYALMSLLCFSGLIQEAQPIGCFVCESVNRSSPECEDEFQGTQDLYVESCMAAKKSNVPSVGDTPNMRNGLFPASHCIKFKATDESTGETYVIRNCALDSGSTTVDTEIGLISHCGWVRDIKYLGKDMTGCVMSCDSDGCNYASRLGTPAATVSATCLATALLAQLHVIRSAFSLA